MTIKTNLGLVAWCYSLLGEAYWYGCCVYAASESLLKRKAEQYPTHYKDSRMARYRADIKAKKKVSDCIGLVKGYYWLRDDGTTKYCLDGRPDKGANGMFQAAKVKGDIKTLPQVTVIPAKADSFIPLSNKEVKLRLRVAAYARVSTDAEEQLNSYNAQVEYYTDKIQANPEWEFMGVYTDDGTTYGQIPKPL